MSRLSLLETGYVQVSNGRDHVETRDRSQMSQDRQEISTQQGAGELLFNFPVV